VTVTIFHEKTSSARLTVDVPEAGRMLGISRNAAYDAVKRKEIPSVKIGRRIVVPIAALRAMIGEAAD
jgi:excisionase family DNA binding protein